MRHSKSNNGRGGGNEEESDPYKKDKVIEKLRESLQRESNNPDEIVNFLKTDQEEKNKIKQIRL